MDIRQLRYIIEIAEKGSVSKASEALFISQSGCLKYNADKEWKAF